MANNMILFADDSATMRIIMEKTFAAESYDVVAVPSGEAALATARSKNPRVIIADASLSDLSGYDLCEAIRGDATLGSTPVILMSGVSHSYDEARGKSCGATAHMKKPFDTGQLIEKVTELVEASTSDSIPLSDFEPIALGVEPKQAAAAPPPPPPPTPAASGPSMSGRPAYEQGSASMRRPMGSKDTIEFGMPLRPAPKPIPVPAPAAVSAAPADPIKVSTLAELAQMGHDGAPVPQTAQKDAIDLSPPAPATAKPEPRPEISSRIDSHVAAVAQKIGGLSPEQVEAIRVLSTEIVERVVWEVVPELAETLIKEELARLLEE